MGCGRSPRRFCCPCTSIRADSSIGDGVIKALNENFIAKSGSTQVDRDLQPKKSVGGRFKELRDLEGNTVTEPVKQSNYVFPEATTGSDPIPPREIPAPSPPPREPTPREPPVPPFEIPPQHAPSPSTPTPPIEPMPSTPPTEVPFITT